VLLTPSDRLHPQTARIICEQPVRQVYVYGGQAAVSRAVVDAVAQRTIGAGC
jgi:hypothetical protein